MGPLLAAWEGNTGSNAQARLFLHGAGDPAFWRNLISEIVGTLVLVLVVGAIFSKAVAASGPASGLGPYLVAALVWGIGL
jgi:glycerol uptake facilitator protein